MYNSSGLFGSMAIRACCVNCTPGSSGLKVWPLSVLLCTPDGLTMYRVPEGENTSDWLLKMTCVEAGVQVLPRSADVNNPRSVPTTMTPFVPNAIALGTALKPNSVKRIGDQVWPKSVLRKNVC